MNKFIVMGQPRGGSTALRTAIGNHSEVECFHEILHPELAARQPCTGQSGRVPLTPDEAKRELEKLTTKLKFLGFHYNFGDSDHERLVESWLDKAILIDRKNQYDRWKSFYFALQYKQWHQWVGTDHNPQKIKIPEEIIVEQKSFPEISDFIIKHSKIREDMLNWASNLDHLIVDYDDFCHSPDDSLEKAQKFLGLKIEKISSQTRKFKTRNIINEPEILDYLKSKGLS